MKRLVLVGNGFDLAHGLKTKYSDFIGWYINKFMETANRKYEADDEHLLRFSYKGPFPRDTIPPTNDFINLFLNNPRTGYYSSMIHSNLLKISLSKLQSLKWVDLEYEYYSLIKDSLVSSNGNDKAIKKLNLELNFIKNQLSDYLTSTIDYKKIEYSRELAFQIAQKIDYSKLPLGFKKINDEKKEVDELLLLNFNYTSTINHYAYSSKSLFRGSIPINIVNIHGIAGEEIIFGYGDEYCEEYEILENNPEKDLLQNFKSFGYFQNSRYHDFLNFIEADYFEVFVMGHSLGVSDRTLLKQIFEHENCLSIRIFFYDKQDYTLKTYNASSHFSNKILMRKRILPISMCEQMVQAV